MKVYYGLSNYQAEQAVALTIGSFDGIHLGHQEIIAGLKNAAEANGALSAIMTFTPHPRIALNKDRENLRLLSTDAEKQRLLAQFGIDILFFMPFDEAFMQQSADAFLRHMLIEKIGMRHIVLGYDHRFGNNREGDIHFLKNKAAALSFTVEEIPRQTIDDLAVSSTKIRQAIELGDITLANKMLGYPYSVSGKVVSGDKLGRTIGYPTANLHIDDPYKQLPAHGVYACRVHRANSLIAGMCYIGNRPTISGQRVNVEVNLLDWSGDLYGEALHIDLIAQTRADIKFASLDALKAQIAADEEQIRAILR